VLLDVLLFLSGGCLMAVLHRVTQAQLERRFNELLRREEERSKVTYKQAKGMTRQWAVASKESARLFDRTRTLHRDMEILLLDPKVADALKRGHDEGGRRHG
jgi:hypothetical protein